MAAAGFPGPGGQAAADAGPGLSFAEPGVGAARRWTMNASGGGKHHGDSAHGAFLGAAREPQGTGEFGFEGGNWGCAVPAVQRATGRFVTHHSPAIPEFSLSVVRQRQGVEENRGNRSADPGYGRYSPSWPETSPRRPSLVQPKARMMAPDRHLGPEPKHGHGRLGDGNRPCYVRPSSFAQAAAHELDEARPVEVRFQPERPETWRPTLWRHCLASPSGSNRSANRSTTRRWAFRRR